MPLRKLQEKRMRSGQELKPKNRRPQRLCAEPVRAAVTPVPVRAGVQHSVPGRDSPLAVTEGMPPAGLLPGRAPLPSAGMDRRQPDGATEARPDRPDREPDQEAAFHKEEQQRRDPDALMRRERASAAEKARIRKPHLTAKTRIGREVHVERTIVTSQRTSTIALTRMTGLSLPGRKRIRTAPAHSTNRSRLQPCRKNRSRPSRCRMFSHFAILPTR